MGYPPQVLEWLKYIRPAEEQPSTHDEIALRDIVLIGIILRAVEETYIQDAIGDLNLDLRISGSVSEALVEPTDVLIDFTKADVVKANVMAAITKGVHVVIGSSGLSDEDFVEINQAALDNNVGAIAAGNFAITAVLLQRFACEAAKYLSHWEIIDCASDAKEDAPSGTARELAFQLSEIRRPEVTHPIEQTIGEKESRGTNLNGSQIHSIRLPSYVLSVEAIFGAKDERLTIRHDAGSGAEPYIQGTLLAVRKVKDCVGLVRGLDKMMD